MRGQPPASPELGYVTFLALLGQGLASARTARGLSQEELAALAGVSRKSVNALEAGHHGPTLRTLLRLLTALGAGSLQQLATSFLIALLRAEQGSPPSQPPATAPNRKAHRPKAT